jgi:hypothetical protein
MLNKLNYTFSLIWLDKTCSEAQIKEYIYKFYYTAIAIKD